MKIIRPDTVGKYDEVIVSCDVGGTKTDLGLVGARAGELELICHTQLKSQELVGLGEPLQQFITELSAAGFQPAAVAIAAAGPTEHNSCQLTNCDFDIDGQTIEQETGLRTFVINDFLAMAWGALTFDVHDAKSGIQIQPGKKSGPPPSPGDGVKLIVGPGTGLGLAYVVPGDRGPLAQSSEGGHIVMAPFDSRSEEFLRFLQKTQNKRPTAEMCISGQGIANIYRFLQMGRSIPTNPITDQIDNAKEEEKPKLIADQIGKESICTDTMNLFAGFLGSYTANMAAVFLPHGGIYLTGGIARKNAKFLASSREFQKAFLSHPEGHIRNILKGIAIYIVTNEQVSLLGAAAFTANAKSDKI